MLIDGRGDVVVVNGRDMLAAAHKRQQVDDKFADAGLVHETLGIAEQAGDFCADAGVGRSLKMTYF